MALLAQIGLDPRTADQRGATRRSLRLEVEHELGEGTSRALVRNLSETGLLLESETALAIDEELTVHLPEVGAVTAKVIWARRPFFGCEFARPVSRAAVSAALLKSPVDEDAVVLATPVDTTWRLSEPSVPAPTARISLEANIALILLSLAVAAFILAIVGLQLG